MLPWSRLRWNPSRINFFTNDLRCDRYSTPASAHRYRLDTHQRPRSSIRHWRHPLPPRLWTPILYVAIYCEGNPIAVWFPLNELAIHSCIDIRPPPAPAIFYSCPWFMNAWSVNIIPFSWGIITYLGWGKKQRQNLLNMPPDLSITGWKI